LTPFVACPYHAAIQIGEVGMRADHDSGMHSLEQRLVRSATIDPLELQLDVEGTAASDSITLTYDSSAGKQARVDINGEVSSFSLKDVFHISIDGLAGDDSIRIIETHGPLHLDVTIHGNEGDDTVRGASEQDAIWGDDGGDQLDGGAGNDVIIGLAGDDGIRGGLGDDSIEGDDGNDTIDGGDGNDTITGNNGNDSINGAEGDDSISGGLGADKIYGEDGKDTLNGDGGNDIIVGGRGDDDIEGGAGYDRIEGSDGDDLYHLFFGDYAYDPTFDTRSIHNLPNFNADLTFVEVDGTSRDDVISISVPEIDRPQPVSVTVNGQTLIFKMAKVSTLIIDAGAGDDVIAMSVGGRIADNTDLQGGDGNDTISGDARTIEGGDGDNLLIGFGAPQQIYALTGNSTLFGGGGDDTLSSFGEDSVMNGEAGNDLIDAMSTTGNSTLSGGSGNDQIFGTPVGNNVIGGGSGNDLIEGGSEKDTLTGGDGDDVIKGFGGRDLISGGAGEDDLDGGRADDRIYGGPGNDDHIAVFDSPSELMDFTSADDGPNSNAYDSDSSLPTDH
jgi:Ca2+-binding RTX toxin-like protein